MSDELAKEILRDYFTSIRMTTIFDWMDEASYDKFWDAANQLGIGDLDTVKELLDKIKD